MKIIGILLFLTGLVLFMFTGYWLPSLVIMILGALGWYTAPEKKEEVETPTAKAAPTPTMPAAADPTLPHIPPFFKEGTETSGKQTTVPPKK